ncbi:uncharacterized protein LOC129595127 [Paramacrobiotus metropolitanus]|uniref:uncharacterized protein LOC129595127 n=1 Tax=Paramacrobiotus metropolitanus TaxID=2943436 RepID=UPI0024458A01|nr:uncharacterized protein LOC129595127 [Paramacrobiotus metropolitanus]
MSKTAACFVLFLIHQCAGIPDHAIQFETDCNAPDASTAEIIKTAPPINSFRTDTLAADECRTYAKMLCGDGKHDYCIMSYPPGSDMSPLTKTYFEMSCWEGGTRTAIAVYARNVSLTSPNRAITLELAERNDTEDPVHHDAVDPIRQQIIQMQIRHCATATITAKIFGAGEVPNLVSLRVWQGRDLVVKRRDFSRMPNVRMIIFGLTTIQELEPYTFTDIAHLESLTLEMKIGYILYIMSKPEHDQFWEPGSLQGKDLDKVKKIHCDCSFAWFRNFLKRKPHLIQEKREGEVAVIGNYLSESTNTGIWKGSLSVDCSMAFNYNNTYYTKNRSYSYNTSCYNLVC